uniref:Uncharacterized protein n=1 Tax=Lygus hesperus TaxID=30085 RepID=A0A0A9XYJ2_LYGHE
MQADSVDVVHMPSKDTAVVVTAPTTTTAATTAVVNAPTTVNTATTAATTTTSVRGEQVAMERCDSQMAGVEKVKQLGVDASDSVHHLTPTADCDESPYSVEFATELETSGGRFKNSMAGKSIHHAMLGMTSTTLHSEDALSDESPYAEEFQPSSNDEM